MAIIRFEELLGMHEQPPGSNNVPGITTFLHTTNGTGTGNSPWCAEAVSRVLSDVGQHDFYGHQFVNGIAYVPFITSLAKGNGRFRNPAVGAPGDVVILVWGGAGSNPEGDHAGMVVAANADRTYRTIEGNAPGTDSGVGDEVAYHTRNQSFILGFYRPVYDGSTPPRPTPPPAPPVVVGHPYPGRTFHLSSPLIHGADVQAWQARMTVKGYPLTTDGVYGSLSATACNKFQRAHKLVADSIVGPVTWTAVWS
jgi:hypothetical protein